MVLIRFCFLLSAFCFSFFPRKRLKLKRIVRDAAQGAHRAEHFRFASGEWLTAFRTSLRCWHKLSLARLLQFIAVHS